MDIWKELEKWYTQRGISTAEFFNNNSTEMGRDEMIMDFAYRMLKGNFDVSASQLKHAIREIHKGPDANCKHLHSTYNGEASWCYDCKSISLVEDIAKSLAKMDENSAITVKIQSGEIN